nr:type I toxin-antitoxin system Fst family toxin [Streptococcus devriesei]
MIIVLIVAPIVVRAVLALFSKWQDRKDDD